MKWPCPWLVGCFIISSVCVSVKGGQSGCRDIVEEPEECRPWCFKNSNESECILGKEYDDIVQRYHKSTSPIAELQLGYCMTYFNNSTYLMACPYDVVGGRTNEGSLVGQNIVLNFSLSDLNEFTCAHLNRNGKHCAQCNNGTGQGVFSLDLGCYNCSELHGGGWALYMFLEFVPPTVFIFGILFLQVSPTKPNMKVFVFYAQLVTMLLSLSYEQPYKYVFRTGSFIFVKIMKTMYGFWNLDFFRSAVPPFCISEHLDNLQVISFQYLSIVYLTILAVIAWGIVELHERECSLMVRVWKPFRRYLSHYSVTSNPKSTIMSAFATIITLSYTKVLYVSANLLDVVKEYRVCQENNSHLFLQPDIKPFGPKHAPFVVLATLMLVIYVVTPLLILLLYQVGFIQEKLRLFCVRHSNVQMFAEAFYKPYKDGMNNTRDCRLFCTLYLFLRIVLILVFVKSSNSIMAYIIAAVMHGVVIGLLCAFKPYKQAKYNYLDISVISGFAVALLFAAFTTHNRNSVIIVEFVVCTIFIIMLIPLLYVSIRVLVLLVRALKMVNFKAIIQRRRRGYVEIGVYGNDMESSVGSDAEHHQSAREKDSFQSE